MRDQGGPAALLLTGRVRGEVPGPGPAGVRLFAGSTIGAAFPGYRLPASGADQVCTAAQGRRSCRRPSQYAHVFEFRDGKVIRFQQYTDTRHWADATRP